MCFCLLPLVYFLSAVQSSDPEFSDVVANVDNIQAIDDSWRNARRCGPNSLYLFLRLRDIEVNHKDILDSVPIDESGSSIADLRKCADKFGCSTTVMRCTPNELKGLQLPVIVHLSNMRDGHFAVLLRIDEKNSTVLLGDGNACELKSIPFENFEQNWSGFVLITTLSYYYFLLEQLSVPVFSIALVIFIFCVFRYLNRRFQAQSHTPLPSELAQS